MLSPVLVVFVCCFHAAQLWNRWSLNGNVHQRADMLACPSTAFGTAGILFIVENERSSVAVRSSIFCAITDIVREHGNHVCLTCQLTRNCYAEKSSGSRVKILYSMAKSC